MLISMSLYPLKAVFKFYVLALYACNDSFVDLIHCRSPVLVYFVKSVT